MDRIKFYERLYFAELRRKEELRGALSLPTGVLTLLGGVVVVYLGEIVEGFATGLGIDLALVVLSVLSFLLIASFVMTALHLLASHHNYTYDYVPYATDIEQAYQEFVDHYDSREEADAQFEASVLSSLVAAHRKNAFNNDSKSTKLHKANRTLIYCLLLALLCSIPYYISTLRTGEVVPNIESVDPASNDSASEAVSPAERDVHRESEQQSGDTVQSVDSTESDGEAF